MTVVLDASAMLAFLQGESGDAEVAAALVQGSACSAVNWSELAQKILASDRDWVSARALLMSYGLQIEPVSKDDAESAARKWKRGDGLSLADRLCLALGERIGARVLTADKAWGQSASITQIR